MDGNAKSGTEFEEGHSCIDALYNDLARLRKNKEVMPLEELRKKKGFEKLKEDIRRNAVESFWEFLLQDLYITDEEKENFEKDWREVLEKENVSERIQMTLFDDADINEFICEIERLRALLINMSYKEFWLSHCSKGDGVYKNTVADMTWNEFKYWTNEGRTLSIIGFPPTREEYEAFAKDELEYTTSYINENFKSLKTA